MDCPSPWGKRIPGLLRPGLPHSSQASEGLRWTKAPRVSAVGGRRGVRKGTHGPKCLGWGSPYPCCLHLRSPKFLKCKAITVRRARATD